MDSNLVLMLVQLGVDEAPAIIKAIQSRGGTVQNVGPILDQDAQTIASDLAQLTDEQKTGDAK